MGRKLGSRKIGSEYQPLGSISDSINTLRQSEGESIARLESITQNEPEPLNSAGRSNSELTDTENDGLRDSKRPRMPLPLHQRPQLSQARAALRVLGLQALFNLFSRGPVVEEPKPVMIRSMRVTLLSLLIHLIPMGGAVALVILNLKGAYIGGELAGLSGDYDDIKLFGLQLAAKLHELFMLASVGVVVTGIIRRELVNGEGVPFGIFAGCFGTISWLWSKEMVGTYKSTYRSVWRKYRVIFATSIGLILSVTVGPASAVAMRPRLGIWPAGGSYFYLNATRERLVPMEIGESDIPTTCMNQTEAPDGCGSEGWQVIGTNFLSYFQDLAENRTMPEDIHMQSQDAVRIMHVRQELGLWGAAATFSTISMANIASNVAEITRQWNMAVNQTQSRFNYWKDIKFSVFHIPQPLVQVKCTLRDEAHFSNQSKKAVVFPFMDRPCDGHDPIRVGDYGEPEPLDELFAKYNDPDLQSPTLQFVPVPTAGGPSVLNDSSVGAIVTIPDAWPRGKGIAGCSVQAVWVSGYMAEKRTLTKMVDGAPDGIWHYRGTCDREKRRLPLMRISPEFSNSLNPSVGNTSLDVFQHLANTIAIGDKFKDHLFVETYLESILTTMISNGLGRIQASAIMYPPLKPDWIRELLPKGLFGYGGSIYQDVPFQSDEKKMTQFRLLVDIEGYAYRYTGNTIRLVTGILLAYVFFALGYILICLPDKWYSDSWDSISELTALAMQSQPTTALKNTSAGIWTSSVFANKVQVVERRKAGQETQRSLELSFEGDPHENQQRIALGQLYD